MFSFRTSGFCPSCHAKRPDGWGETYNYIRPHQSLDYLIPYEYYQRWLKEHNPKVSLM